MLLIADNRRGSSGKTCRQRNRERLEKDGVLFAGPNDGEMACGEFGPGRMAEPLEIVAAIEFAEQSPDPDPAHLLDNVYTV